MKDQEVAGAPSRASLRRGNLTVKFLRAVARLPKGHGLIWRILVPFSPGRLRNIVCDTFGFYLHLDLTELLDFEYAVDIWDRMELEFLVNAVEDGTHFLDIGANQGFYSLFVAWRRPAARILSFEPDDYSLDKIRRNVSSNKFGNITVCPYALSDREEVKTLIIDQDRNRGASSLLRARPDGSGCVSTVEVPCKPLLEALREHGVERIGALKIDVEGYEYLVLRKFLDDAPASLYPKVIVVEALGDRIAAVGGSPVELLVSRGYRIVNHNRFNFLMELNRPHAA